MASNPFEKLLQSSKELAELSKNSSGVPQLNRDLGQIATETNLLTSKVSTGQPLNANAHYFLAQGGSNTHEVTTNLKDIDTKVIFQPTEVIENTDVEGYLEKVQGTYMREITQETRQKTRQNLLHHMEQQLHDNWATMQTRILSAWDQEQDNKLFGKHCVQSKTQMHDYANAIRELNQKRLHLEKVPLIPRLQQVLKSTTCTKTQRSFMNDTWDIVAHVAKDIEQTAYPKDSLAITRMNQSMIASVKKWLENQYLGIANQALLSSGSQSLGGSPSIIHRMCVFSRILYNSITSSSSLYFEIDNNTPIWLLLYILFRIGRPELALQYVDDHQQQFYNAPGFLNYLRAYLSSKDHLLSQDMQEQVRSQYRMMTYGNQPIDPYKKLLYKIMGRCELHITGLDMCKETEDYLWLQLSLIREGSDYTLSSLQKTIVHAGPDHYDSKKLNPWYYAYVLTLTCQFERATAFMYTQQQFRLEAVHYGIAAAYYNLIRVSNDVTELLATKPDGNASLSLSRLIKQYVDFFEQASVEEVINYYCLLTLCPTQDMADLCHEYIADYAAKQENYKDILGDKLTYRPGLIETYKPLLGLESEQAYKENVLERVAQHFDMCGKYKDAISIYELAGDYHKGLAVLNQQLDYALDRPMAILLGKQHYQSLVDDNDLIACCHAASSYAYVPKDDMVAKTHSILLLLLMASKAYEAGKHEEALELIKSAHVIPFEDNGSYQSAVRATEIYKSMDETVKKHVPGIVMMTVEVLYSLYKYYSDQSAYTLTEAQKQYMADQCKKWEIYIKSLKTFAGMISSDIPVNVLHKLIKKLTELHQ
ncbi:hypothetical protein CU098_000027 [Rhizopus stolonifer]|uniref:Nuclear pore protein n=1 Tax=Rhizopus stolonifer TaxID=4846 RepID=A0A367K7P9_RHIST|nr:hypothetical protein CU098_000027 [Rhizopus stolonifer]